jgi:AcrR family transcriptional regulator
LRITTIAACIVSEVTDSPARQRSGKRERLVSAAADLVHQHGLEGLTLARVAEAADVPVGNVYYYFKTRDDLIRAVVDERVCEVSALLEVLSERRTPRSRLKALAQSWADTADVVAGHGCPLGSLASELARHDDDLSDCAQVPLSRILEWMEAQFRELGERNAAGRAVALLGAIQGAALLANAFHDPELMVREVRRLERELDATS